MSFTENAHFEVPAPLLAAWIEGQGDSLWWNVDGDPLLTGLVDFPCPGDELAEVIRKIGRPLWVRDPEGRPDARGRVLAAAEEIDTLADVPWSRSAHAGERPAWADDRVFACRWKDRGEDWLLAEDRETTRSNQRDVAELASRKAE